MKLHSQCWKLVAADGVDEADSQNARQPCKNCRQISMQVSSRRNADGVDPISITPQIIYEHRYQRVEFDWVAVDVDGFVGFFSTAGVGPIPSSVLAAGEQTEDILAYILELPSCTAAVLTSKFQHDVRDWAAVAERGVFAFDWRVGRSVYELIAVPSIAVTIDMIVSAKVQQLAAGIILPISLPMTKMIAARDQEWISG